MFDMFKMMGRLGEIKEKIAQVKASLNDIVLEESELDGVVTIEITAARIIKKIRTSPEFYEKYSVEEREAILTEAVNNAFQKAESKAKEVLQDEMKDIIPNIPGLDLGSLLS